MFILASLGLTKKLSVLEPILILLTCRLYRLSGTIDYMERKKPSLREIFSPHGIAVVGASSSGESSFATMVVESLKEAGFPVFHSLHQAAKAIARVAVWNQL